MGSRIELSWLDEMGNPRELSHLSELGKADVLQDYYVNMTPAQKIETDRYVLSCDWANKHDVLKLVYTMNCGRAVKENT